MTTTTIPTEICTETRQCAECDDDIQAGAPMGRNEYRRPAHPECAERALRRAHEKTAAAAERERQVVLFGRAQRTDPAFGNEVADALEILLFGGIRGEHRSERNHNK